MQGILQEDFSGVPFMLPKIVVAVVIGFDLLDTAVAVYLQHLLLLHRVVNFAIFPFRLPRALLTLSVTWVESAGRNLPLGFVDATSAAWTGVSGLE